MSEQRYEILLTKGAEQDLEAIYDYIAEYDSEDNANYVLDALMEVVGSLANFPDRGPYPKELIGVGIQEYRQAFFKPYRIIYRTINRNLYIVLIADGRRDIQALLSRRLLGS